MKPYDFVIPVALAAGALVIAIYSRRRSNDNLLKAVNPELAARLMPYAGIPESPVFLDKEELWKAIGGIRGVWGICRAAGAIATLAARIAEAHPEARSAATETLVSASYLRVVAMICLAEAAICNALPMLPRMLAWTLARHYCDLVSTLSAAGDLASVADANVY
jgi:hypothetical protein